MAAKQKVEEKEGTIIVGSTVLGITKEKAKQIKIRPFATDTATVGIKYGLTIPTGDYASARVDVFINVPCYVEEIVLVYKQVRNLADKLIEHEAKKFEAND